MDSVRKLAFLGFGEAAMAFRPMLILTSDGFPSVYDIKTDDNKTREAKLAEYEKFDVVGCGRLAEALDKANLILSLVTADQAIVAARNASRHIVPGALYCDMNSIAPQKKKEAKKIIEQVGGCYLDVAVMAPVYPAKVNVPLLVSGKDSDTAAQELRQLGFSNANAVGNEVGHASAIKMCRSIIVKGMEALTAEAMLAAKKAGVLDAVLDSLGPEWNERADYNLDRMIVHGNRRAAEMIEVVNTLDSLGQHSSMAKTTANWQRRIGALALEPADGLEAKLEQIEKGTFP